MCGKAPIQVKVHKEYQGITGRPARVEARSRSSGEMPSRLGRIGYKLSCPTGLDTNYPVPVCIAVW